MQQDLLTQKSINANLINRLCYTHHIPFVIDEDTMFDMNEEELFMALWDVHTFITSKFQDIQLYKMWSEKINVFTEDNLHLK